MASARVNTGTTNAPEGGRIQALAIDTADPATFSAPLLAPPGFSEWSPPVNLGPLVNSRFNDAGPALSKDGLSLYFQSNRTPGGFGGNDIWVSQRASREDAWGEPVNLGPTINTAFNEDAPAFSRDGHTMYFNSDRPGGGFGLRDIWIARRTNTRDDFGWEEPVNARLVNSTLMDAGPSYLENGEAGTPLLYFGSTRLGGLYDIYVSAQAADGSWGPADLVPELSSPQSDQRPSVRFDGLELFLHSDRPGSVLTDLWVSTRETTLDPWSAPVNLGATVNSPSLDQQPFIASDRETLFFASDRPDGGFGNLDIYVTTREKNPHEVPESVVGASLVPVTGVGKHELMRSIASKKDVYQPFSLPCGGAGIEGIACGATKSRDLATTDCRDSGYYFDFYSFSGTAGQQVTIRLTSSGFVPGIGLYDPFEQLIAGAYNARGGTSTLLVFTLNVSGTWRIGVNGDTDETGAYTLTLECSAAASCVPDPTALCLNNGRFRVAATFLTPDGRSGNGQIVPETSDTGLFWFFSASNIEAIVKVVNGCAFNDRYWVFAAGLTNVQVVLTVTDTSTGETRTYTNPQGTPFAPIQDTNAFAACR